MKYNQQTAKVGAKVHIFEEEHKIVCDDLRKPEI